VDLAQRAHLALRFHGQSHIGAFGRHDKDRGAAALFLCLFGGWAEGAEDGDKHDRADDDEDRPKHDQKFAGEFYFHDAVSRAGDAVKTGAAKSPPMARCRRTRLAARSRRALMYWLSDVMCRVWASSRLKMLTRPVRY